MLCATRDGEVLDDRLIAVVIDEELPVPVPRFPLDPEGPVCDFIKESFLGEA
jgi:hypothetical protein